MRIYKHTLLHQGWEDDINELAVYTTWPMNKQECVEYYNENIAGRDINGCEDFGVVHDIYMLDDLNSKTAKFPWLEYVLDKDDDDFDDLKLSDDSDLYTFGRQSFEVIQAHEDEKKINDIWRDSGQEEI